MRGTFVARTRDWPRHCHADILLRLLRTASVTTAGYATALYWP
jgi:hypothetical protein